MIRRIYITISLFCVLLALGANVQARSHATPTPTPKTSPRATGRLIVQRAPNFGTDLSTFPLIEGAKPVWPRGVASLSYEGPGDVTSAFSAIGVELEARK